MSHNDYIKRLPEGFEIIGHTAKCPCAVIRDEKRKFYGVQFHPEVNHTERGFDMLGNFLYELRNRSPAFTRTKFTPLSAKAASTSSPSFFLIRPWSTKMQVSWLPMAFATDSGVNFVRVNAGERFLSRLAGIEEPEQKRKIIGEEFIRVFEDEAKKIGQVDFLVQGTIYPDVIESGSGDAAVIKSHHNVGGLPDYVDFKEIIEPLRLLFKDEVRALGTALGLDEKLVWRQPFPGPGLAIKSAVMKSLVETPRRASV